jgi:hypothetical protein
MAKNVSPPEDAVDAAAKELIAAALGLADGKGYIVAREGETLPRVATITRNPRAGEESAESPAAPLRRRMVMLFPNREHGVELRPWPGAEVSVPRQPTEVHYLEGKFVARGSAAHVVIECIELAWETLKT